MSVVVKYRLIRTYCSCCNQKLPVEETSYGDFEISKKRAVSWALWDDVAEYPEDMDGMVSDFIHETISFDAASAFERIKFDDSEVEKVKAFILREVVEEASQ